MDRWSPLNAFGLLALAAGLAPFLFFGLILLMMFGLTTVATAPLVFAFLGWMFVRRSFNRQREEVRRARREDEVIEARIIREDGPLPYPNDAYTPPVHFDLLLEAKQDVGRILGAAAAMQDRAVSAQFRSLAARADTILVLVAKEPAKLALARRFFSSYLPRAADLADGYHRMLDTTENHEARRAKLIDVISRLETAMKRSEGELSAPDLARIDADLRILNEDLRGVEPSQPSPGRFAEDRPREWRMPAPDFTKVPEPIFNRVNALVEEAKQRKKKRKRDDDDD